MDCLNSKTTVAREAGIYIKGSGTSNNLIGFVDFQNGTTTRVQFTNVIDTLCDGDLHHVIISYNGRTNGSGQIVDFDMIIDGTAATTSHNTSGTNANSTLLTLKRQPNYQLVVHTMVVVCFHIVML